MHRLLCDTCLMATSRMMWPHAATSRIIWATTHARVGIWARKIPHFQIVHLVHQLHVELICNMMQACQTNRHHHPALQANRTVSYAAQKRWPPHSASPGTHLWTLVSPPSFTISGSAHRFIPAILVLNRIGHNWNRGKLQ